MSSWTIYLNNGKSYTSDDEFLNSLKSVGTLATYKAFKFSWETRVRSAFSGSFRVFRDDITPNWDHPAHEGSGSMLTAVRAPRKHSYSAFLALMQGLMESTLHHGQLVLGVVIAFRPWGYTMSLWLRKGTCATTRAELSRSVQRCTGDDSLDFTYMTHEHLAESTKNRPKRLRQDRLEGRSTDNLKLDPETGRFVKPTERKRLLIEKLPTMNKPATETEQQLRPPPNAALSPVLLKTTTRRDACLVVGAFCLSAFVLIQYGSVGF